MRSYPHYPYEEYRVVGYIYNRYALALVLVHGWQKWTVKEVISWHPSTADAKRKLRELKSCSVSYA